MGRMVEVDEEEFARNVKLRNTIATWMSNPKAKRKLLEAHKEYDPSVKIPELDEPDPVDARIQPLATEVQALKQQLADEKAERSRQANLDAFESKIESGFAKLRREGLTSQGEEAVRSLMQAEGIANPEIAWNHLQRTTPQQAPVTPGGINRWNFFDQAEDQADFKKLIETRGENEGVTDKLAHDALREMRGNR